MEFTFKELEATLLLFKQVRPDRAGTFRSRLKQLQRLEFPSGVNVGRGARMTYSAEHSLKLALAIELIGSGYAAGQATSLVEEHWREFSAAFALAALSIRIADAKPVYAAITVSAFHEIQFSQAFITPTRVIVLDNEALPYTINAAYSPTSYGRLLVSATTILQALSDAAERAAGIGGLTYSSELLQWLPRGTSVDLNFGGKYPDRSNLAVRSNMNALWGNDPDADTPDGAEEARDFAAQLELGSWGFGSDS